jgi:hypothetical protein
MWNRPGLGARSIARFARQAIPSQGAGRFTAMLAAAIDARMMIKMVMKETAPRRAKPGYQASGRMPLPLAPTPEAGASGARAPPGVGRQSHLITRQMPFHVTGDSGERKRHTGIILR